MHERIKLHSPEITQEELAAAASQVFENGIYTRGPEVPKFEQKLQDTVGAENALATSNGTTALHLGVRAVGWQEGDKVITSPLSFIATTNALLQERCVPVFGQINDGLQLDLEQAAELIEKDPDIKGILMPVIFGHSVDVEMIARIKANYPEITIIEDAAQALAPSKFGLGIGDGCDMATYSFHENKVITTMGEGGAVTTNDQRLAEAIRRMREQGRVDGLNWKDLIELGYNYRMTDMQAHTGAAQLDRLESVLEKRAGLARHMSRLILESELPLQSPNEVNRSWFGYYVVAETPEKAALVARGLNDKGIAARHAPMPAIPSFNHVARSPHEDHSTGVADLSARVILLPLHTKLEEEDIQQIVSTLKVMSREYGSSNTIKRPSSSFYDAVAHQYEAIRNERAAYLDRVDEIIEEGIQNKAGRKSTMLDIGCGDGTRGKGIAERAGCDLVSIDSSNEMVRIASENGVNAQVVDIARVGNKLEGKSYDVVTMLWNVLGHIPGNDRLLALENVRSLMTDEGVLFLDVNNRFNAAHYGEENVAKNRRAATYASSSDIGDFITTRKDKTGEEISTVSHIFHAKEITELLEKAGFAPTVRYINYQTGQDADESSGQIVIVATKSKA